MAVVSKGDRTLKLLGVCWEKGESEGTRWASSVPDGSLLRTCCGLRWVKSYSPVGVRLALGCVCGHRGRSAPEASPGLPTTAFGLYGGRQGAAIKDYAEQEWKEPNAH